MDVAVATAIFEKATKLDMFDQYVFNKDVEVEPKR